MESFLRILPVVAGHPLALVAYLAVVIAWVVVTLQVRKSIKLFRTIKHLPESDCLEAIRLEYRTVPKAGLSAEQWLRSQRMKFIFAGFGLSLLTIVVLVSFTFAQVGDAADLLRRAEALMSEGQYIKAAEVAQRASEIDPKIAKVRDAADLLRHASLLMSQRRYIEAAEVAQRASEIDPKIAESWFVLGIAKHWAGRSGGGGVQYQDGLAAIKKARDLVEVKEARYSYSLGSILAQMGRHEEALTYYEEALKLRPAYPVAIYAMGYSYRELGDIDKALEHYNDTIKLAGDLVPESAFAVARIYAQTLQPGEPCPQDSDHVREALRALSVMLERGGDEWAWVLLGKVPRRGVEQLDPLRECTGFAELRVSAQRKLGIVK